MTTADEADMTEITILGDGRIYVFGASATVLAALLNLCPGDAGLQRRVEAACGQDASAHAGSTAPSGEPRGAVCETGFQPQDLRSDNHE
jgi:hypothetical protein